MDYYHQHNHQHQHHPKCPQKQMNSLTYIMNTSPDRESPIGINQQEYDYNANDNHNDQMNIYNNSQINDLSTYHNDKSPNYNNTLTNYTEPNNQIMHQAFNTDRANKSAFNKSIYDSNTSSTPLKDYSISQSLYLHTNAQSLMSHIKSKDKIKPKTSLIKSALNSHSIIPGTPLSRLTTKKIAELKMKQLSDSINLNNESMILQRNTTSSSIPLKNNSMLQKKPISFKNNEDNDTKEILITNDEKLHEFIMEENAQLKQLNERYKQMLDSAFYFINSLSYMQNNAKEYDVNYYTDHIGELNNALLDLEKILRIALDQSTSIKERELKEKEAEFKAQILSTLLQERHEALIASLRQITEIDFSIIVLPKEPIVVERNIFPSFGNEIMTDELISDQKEPNNNYNKNCIACMVGANNSTRGYSPMKYNPNHYKSNDNIKVKQLKKRSITPTNRKLKTSNQKCNNNSLSSA